jgi:ABC-2 type transport system permease protein
MIKFLIEKEFKQIFRHAFMPKVIIILPIMTLLVMPWAANQEIRDMKLSIVDNDHSVYSERLVRKVLASGYFLPANVSPSYAEALKSMDAGLSDAILEIAPDFERELVKTGTAQVMVSVNAVNGAKGGIGSNYLTEIIGGFTQELLAERGMETPPPAIVPYYRFNPLLDYKVFMVPALMAMLLTLLVGFLPALNIAGEKETGAIEQMNVTPVNKFTFILAKLIPYWLIGFIVLSIGLIIAALLYRLTPVGSLATIFLYTTLYGLVVSGLGLVISNYSSTMQQAQFVMIFFLVVFLLMSGLFFPISSMPEGVQPFTLLNPMRYFMEVMRAVFLKGSTVADLLPQLFALCGFGVLFNAWAVWSYRKSS